MGMKTQDYVVRTREEADKIAADRGIPGYSESYVESGPTEVDLTLSLNFDFLWQKPNNKSGKMQILHNYCMMKMLDDLRNQNTFLEQQVQNLVIDQYK